MNKTQGRRVCDVLKEIRNKIAKEGNLKLNQKECKFKGECSGTCPTCETELKKINETFDHKKLLSIAGCIGMALPMTACSTDIPKTDELQGDVIYEEDILIAKDETETSKEKLPEDLIAGKIEPKKYVFTEDEESFPKGVTTLEDLEISEKMKQLIKDDFPKNHLRGVINPNAKFH